MTIRILNKREQEVLRLAETHDMREAVELMEKLDALGMPTKQRYLSMINSEYHSTKAGAMTAEALEGCNVWAKKHGMRIVSKDDYKTIENLKLTLARYYGIIRDADKQKREMEKEIDRLEEKIKSLTDKNKKS